MAEQWYCIHVNANQDDIACRNLMRQGFTVFSPRFSPAPRAALRAVFPGYLFVQFDADRDRWQLIYSTAGVKHLFMRAPGRPLAMDPEFIERVKQDTSGQQWQAPAPPPAEGAHVRITDTSLQEFDMEGICTMSSAQRVDVLLVRLGRLTRVRFDAHSVVSV
jgi:transcriptional antiterminator RfaH